MGYDDLYVLAPERTVAVAENFLGHFAPEREQASVDYCFPRYVELPQLVLESAEEAMHYCVSHPTEAQSFYFRNTNPEPAHAMLFFTSDGGLILGLSVHEDSDRWFDRLKEHTRCTIGYITHESPPVDTVAAFRVMATARITNHE